MSMEQRSAEWFSARLGRATASRFKHAVARLKPKKGQDKGDPAQARIDYAIELLTERLTGQPTPHFETAAMRWGTDNEPAARIEYAWKREVEVEEIGFIAHPSLAVGASPDGLVGTDGGVEFKCPTSATHIETWLNGMDEEHLWQVQGAMWITGRKWWDFASYDPRMPKELQLYIQRVERDDAFIAAMDAELREFIADVERLEITLKEKAR